MDNLKYPVGRFESSNGLQHEERLALIDKIGALPAKLGETVRHLDDKQLDTPYRDGGWTIRQLVHHLADSHMNSYIRFKLAVTEDAPTIKPYDQASWAELSDARMAPVDLSLRLLSALHERWVRWLRELDEADWERVFEHPESGTMTLDDSLEYYAWHCDHHLAHVEELGRRKGW